MIRTKADILIRYYDNQSRPVVNVNVRGGGYDWDRQIDALIAEGRSDPRAADFMQALGYSAAWIRDNLGESEQENWYQAAIEDAWEELRDTAAEIYPGRVVYSAGRSGGWAYVQGFTADDVGGWDALALTRWRKFDQLCASIVADLPYRYADLVWANVYEVRREEREEEARDVAAHAQLIGYALQG